MIGRGGNVSVVELVWTLTSLVGLFYAVRLFALASGDAAFLRRTGDTEPSRRIIAEMNRRTALLRMTITGAFVVVGFIAFQYPEPVNSRFGSRHVVLGIFIAIAVAEAVVTMFDIRDRKRIEREVDV